MHPDQQPDASKVRLMDRMVHQLGKLEFVAVFIPVVFLAADCALLHLTGITVLPYQIFDTKGYLLAALIAIVILAVVLSEMKSSALGSDTSVTVNLGFGNLSLPKNTTEKLIESYFNRRKSGESIRLVVMFVGLEMLAMFLYGTLVALLIYKNYLRSIMFG